MDLTQVMREATATPPPSRINIDVLIALETRRHSMLLWTGRVVAAVVALAVLGTALAIPKMLGARPGDRWAAGDRGSGVSSEPSTPAGVPCVVTSRPPGEPDPFPADYMVNGCARAITRFTEAVDDILKARKITPENADNGKDPPITFKVIGGMFMASVYLNKAGKQQRVLFEIRPNTPASFPTLQDTCRDITECGSRTNPDGTVVYYLTQDFLTNVEAYRPDGTIVRVASEELTVLSQDQLIAIASDPRFSMYA